jgi:hypothetical protein
MLEVPAVGSIFRYFVLAIVTQIAAADKRTHRLVALMGCGGTTTLAR